ncbi:UNVERIFIED_CONTAM: hypothetical protein RMT77_009681 [Armadillidium vulgare]
MNRLIKIIFLSAFIGSINAMGLDLALEEEDLDDQRTLIITATNGTLFGLNLSQLLPLLALAAAALLPLLCLCALSALVFWHLIEKKDDGYGSGYGTSYSEYQRAFNMLDWETLSIVDWISLGEETFRKFEPSNLSCQTRLICELHQNVAKFGLLGEGVVKTFGYLKYLELFSIPDMLKNLFAEYTDAADKGRSLKKDCGDMYPECEFSVTQLYDRYIGNEIQ